MSYLVAIGTALPSFSFSQEEVGRFMVGRMKRAGYAGADKMLHLYRSTQIRERHSVLPDFRENGRVPVLFRNGGGKPEVPGIEERMDIFRREALPLAFEASENCLAEGQEEASGITHLITVSCTGFSAPGLEIDLAHELGVSSSAEHYAINFIGCYAAFHGLRMANDICLAHPEARVLVVCVELCTLHFQEQWDRDAMLANALFGDGAAAALVTGRSSGSEGALPALHLDAFATHLLREGEQEMTWQVGSKGFLMRLSSYIPRLVEGGVDPLFAAALEKAGIEREEVGYWAIHPGGRKLLEVCQERLEIDQEALLPSFRVLESCGNMSSSTILFVLQEVRREVLRKGGERKIFATGFGPGLTMESALLTPVPC